MATGGDMVTGAVKKLGVNPSDSALSPQEMLDGIKALNDMMAEWEESGIVLGFSPIENSAATVRAPRGTHGAIKANLAGRLASDYSKQISPALAAEIAASSEGLLLIAVKPIDVEFPSTLPMGSGNDRFYDDDNFFSENNEENF